MTQATDERFMLMALSLGRRGLGRVWPNPSVGCVIVKDGRVVGRGHTASGGRPHAEPQALAMAGDAARGATAYVTLEPCAHHGKTPPCAEALIAAGVARVVIACEDPDPRVNGGGSAMLRAAGIDVSVGVCEAEARRDHAGFLSKVERGRPMVTLKLAMTLDGRIATASGESQWITGPEARRRVHMQRASHDAVMVGAGTVRADDPSLTVRGLGIGGQPARIVMSASGDLPKSCNLTRTAGEIPVFLCHSATSVVSDWVAAGVRSIPLADGGDCVEALTALGALGLTRIYCEGGGQLAASLLHAGLVDHLVLFTAGKAIGADGRAGLGSLGLVRLADAPHFTLESSETIGPDVMTVWRKA
ncbi:bifunctional diaminohydroxyphosphoribosylaminopyrimidine deaminase/5-amino-6-(5-phosphoribosylamino)uracil reductase RibD [Marivivens sp. LCG002]|uniref:bifunctional diaminohydroxyphosphoribosylaminopyrimidine deaminase/5-amino-6-(5-phosphoribosylamino)uracil reductase RibD n=1 Tax=Marivivens sp. LCG002 TaxID=3051171 RepID=UPI002555A3D6|nr:bifunctional diaminohydroxyphosphoribosylaminopyrimidine deaminase/5-amino-6-(5-phosphoribosylamino)uracil reductase RibD [Marivivens sp. LCG002]WIV51579.1 bifunctional diaminohydroxyphosphoribosylaminopyrimidine deaminase/5-amino-6-(5-phosphoribosylamino)uracil reductase RibD [Marivivens sp. LCG002]